MHSFFAKTLWPVIGISFMLLNCQKERGLIDIAEENKLVEQTIHNSIGWAKDKDIGLLYSIIANDSNYTEVQPNGRIVKGFREFQKAEEFWMHPDFKAIRYEIRDLKITFSKSCDVAWFSCILDDINEWKGQPANWENTRWTGVLEKRDNHWTMVQMHFSYPAD